MASKTRAAAERGRSKRPTQRDVTNIGTYSAEEAGDYIGGFSPRWVLRRIDRERQVLELPVGEGRIVEIPAIPYGHSWRIPKRPLHAAVQGDE
jgi:hypothetical protein